MTSEELIQRLMKMPNLPLKYYRRAKGDNVGGVTHINNIRIISPDSDERDIEDTKQSYILIY